MSATTRTLSVWRASVESGEIEVLGCDDCLGLFIHRDKLARVCPTAAHLPEHSTEVQLTAQRGAGIVGCPSCQAVPHQVELVGVQVDFCTNCMSLWLDGGEYDEALLIDKKETVAPPQNPYRARAQDIPRGRPLEPCVYCQTRLPPNELGFWEHGRICGTCTGTREVQTRMKRGVGPWWLEALLDTFRGPDDQRRH